VGQFVRILIIAIAVWLAIQLLRRALRSSSSSKPTKPAEAQVPRMLQCVRCGVHVPEREALLRGDKVYCSQEHVPIEKR
jgi:uncharacterized protein